MSIQKEDIKLSKNFTLNEMNHSATAIRRKIDNTPNEQVIKCLKELCQNVLQPIRDKIKKPITVTSGYRCEKLNNAVGGAKTSQHCFDQNTEILTNNGWKTIKTISQFDKPYTYNIDKDIIELDEIKDIIITNHDGSLYYAKNKHVEYAVTDEHRMLTRTEKHTYQRKTDRELTEKEKAYLDTLKTTNYKYHIELAKDTHKKRRLFKCAGISNGTNTYDINVLKLCMATIADGFLTGKKKGNIGIGFNLVKERKHKEIEQIFKNLNMPYTKKISKSHIKLGKNNVYTYYVNSSNAKEIFQIIGMYKKIPKWFLSLKPSILKELILTYVKFDGHVDKRYVNSNSATIFTTDNENADMMQLMCIFSGMRCAKSNNIIINRDNTKRKIYHLYINKEKDESRMNEENYKKFYYKGKVWCLTTNNGTVITRRNGKVTIQGNCKGQAADITLGNPKVNKKLFDTIVQMMNNKEIKVGQLIDEYGYRWIHISTPYKHTNQILHIK